MAQRERHRTLTDRASHAVYRDGSDWLINGAAI